MMMKRHATPTKSKVLTQVDYSRMATGFTSEASSEKNNIVNIINEWYSAIQN